MKKLISILLAVAMLACFMVVTVSADEVTTASISGGNPVLAATGDKVAVNFTTSNESGLCAYAYTLTFDSSKLTFVDVTGSGVMYSVIKNGEVYVTFQTGANVTASTFTANFVVAGSCGNYPVKVSVDGLFAFGKNSEKVTLNYTTKAASVKVDHAYGEPQTIAPKSCLEADAGYTVRVCSICGYEDKYDFVKGEHKAGPALQDFIKGATCTEHGEVKEEVFCTVCAELLSTKTVKTDPLGHNWGAWKVIEVATQTKAGLERRDCTRCDAYEENVLPALPTDPEETTSEPTESKPEDETTTQPSETTTQPSETTKPTDPNRDPVPETGDITPYGAFGTVALISMAAAAAYVVTRKFAK